MKSSIDTIASEAMQLPEHERLTLAHRILASVEPGEAPEVERLWEVEIRARIARYDAGGGASIPAAQVFAELDKKLGR